MATFCKLGWGFNVFAFARKVWRFVGVVGEDADHGQKIAVKVFALLFFSAVCLQCSMKTQPLKSSNQSVDISGIWAEVGEQNATFEARNDTIWFTENLSSPSKYDVISDTLHLYNKGIRTSYVILKLTSDSLKYLDDIGILHSLYRFK